MILLETVGATTPAVHVECAVLLLGPGVVVLDRRIVPVGETEVELGQQRPRVVGARNRAIIAPQRAAIGRIHPGAQRRRDAVGVRLLGLVVDLLVVGHEEEGAIALDRPAQRESELVLCEIGRQPQVAMVRLPRERAVLSIIVHRAVQLIRARLRHHVHEAAGGTAELGVGARRRHHDLLHGVEVECEGRTLATALLAEERIIEVGAVDRDVVVNSLLPTDRQLVAVRTLDDRHVGREQRQVQVVAPVVGQPRDRFVRQAGGARHLRRLDDRLRRFDHDRLQLHGRERQIQVDRLTDAQTDAGAPRFTEAHGARRDVVGAERHERRDENAALIRRDLALESSLSLVQDDRRARDRRSRGIGDRAADDACRRL